MDWLNKILEGIPNQEQVFSEIKTQLPKHFVPKDKYNQLSDAKRMLEESKNEEITKKFKNVIIDTMLSSKKDELKIRDLPLLKMLIDKEQISVNESGEISGLTEQLESLVAEKPFLFGNEHIIGHTPVMALNSTSEITKEQFSKMSYRQRSDLFEKNPELYNQLKGE